jgi:serine phosphatase RsbU (regulator of sigma subunit)
VAAIPLALIVVITSADLLSPRHLHLGPLLVVAPAITASFAGPRLTSVIGALAITGQLAIEVRYEALGSLTSQAQITALTLVSGLVVLYCLFRERERRELVQVRSVSEAAQRALLRPVPRTLGPLRLACAYLAAEEEAQIGGDLYAAVRTPGTTRLIIGDARGKGLVAVSDATLLLGAFREAAHRRSALPEVVADLEESTSLNLREASEAEPDRHATEGGEGFVTAAVLDIPDDDPLVKVISCGHPPPLLVRDGRVSELRCRHPAPPLGLHALLSPDYRPQTFRFEEGDFLLLYTDGVIEARDAAGRFYPLTERISSCPGTDPDAVLRYLCGDLVSFAGGHLGDDAALIVIERLPVASRVSRPAYAEAGRSACAGRPAAGPATATLRESAPPTSGVPAPRPPGRDR